MLDTYLEYEGSTILKGLCFRESAFLYKDGRKQILPNFFNYEVEARGVNSRGEVVFQEYGDPRSPNTASASYWKDGVLK